MRKWGGWAMWWQGAVGRLRASFGPNSRWARGVSRIGRAWSRLIQRVRSIKVDPGAVIENALGGLLEGLVKLVVAAVLVGVLVGGGVVVKRVFDGDTGDPAAASDTTLPPPVVATADTVPGNDDSGAVLVLPEGGIDAAAASSAVVEANRLFDEGATDEEVEVVLDGVDVSDDSVHVQVLITRSRLAGRRDDDTEAVAHLNSALELVGSDLAAKADILVRRARWTVASRTGNWRADAKEALDIAESLPPGRTPMLVGYFSAWAADQVRSDALADRGIRLFDSVVAALDIDAAKATQKLRANASNYLGYLFARRNLTDRAMSYYQTARQLGMVPDATLALARLAAYRGSDASTDLALGYYDDAIDEGAPVVATSIDRADALTAADRTDEARIVLDDVRAAAIEASPTAWYVAKARSFAADESYSAAIAELDAALGVDPTAERPAIDRASYRVSNGEPAADVIGDLIEVADRSSTGDADNMVCYLGVWKGTTDLERDIGIEHCVKATQKAQYASANFQLLAEAYWKRGNPSDRDAGRDALIRAHDLAPGNAVWANRLCRWLTDGSSISVANAAVALDVCRRPADEASDDDTLVHLGWAYRQLGRLDEAVDAFERARDESPEWAEVPFQLAMTELVRPAPDLASVIEFLLEVDSRLDGTYARAKRELAAAGLRSGDERTADWIDQLATFEQQRPVALLFGMQLRLSAGDDGWRADAAALATTTNPADLEELLDEPAISAEIRYEIASASLAAGPPTEEMLRTAARSSEALDRSLSPLVPVLVLHWAEFEPETARYLAAELAYGMALDARFDEIEALTSQLDALDAASARYLRGTYALERPDTYAAARDELVAATKLAPEWDSPWRDLAGLYVTSGLGTSADSYEVLGDALRYVTGDAAEEFMVRRFRLWAELHPDDVSLEARARRLYEQTERGDALQEWAYREMIDGGPADEWAPLFKTSIDLVGSDLYAPFFAGIGAIALDDFSGALRAARHALGMQPGWDDAEALEAAALAGLGRCDEALQSVARVEMADQSHAVDLLGRVRASCGS